MVQSTAEPPYDERGERMAQWGGRPELTCEGVPAEGALALVERDRHAISLQQVGCRQTRDPRSDHGYLPREGFLWSRNKRSWCRISDLWHGRSGLASMLPPTGLDEATRGTPFASGGGTKTDGCPRNVTSNVSAAAGSRSANGKGMLTETLTTISADVVRAFRF